MSSQENSKIRIKALLKELDRQQREVRKKKNLIRIIVAAIIVSSLVVFGIAYKQSKEVKPQIVQVKRTKGDIIKTDALQAKSLKVYQVVFNKLNQYPLARFLSQEEALSFQKEIKKLHLPKTYINTDSLDGKERVLAISSNYRYYVQVGMFKKQLIPDLPDNLIYLHQIKDSNLFKYRLGPFARSAQAENLVRDLKIKDYLIVEVSK